MATCTFCKEDRFKSEQAVRGHLKTCEQYLAVKAKRARAALGSVPQGAAAANLSAPKLDVGKPIPERPLKQEASSTPLQQRRTILQAVKNRVIDWHVTSLGQVTSAMRGHAKLKIEQTLARLPLEDIGVEEASEIAASVRDRLYASAFTKQEQAGERQRVETAANRKKEVETLGALLRADRRKTMFRQQASQHAHALCREKNIRGWAHVSVLADVESRLEVLLTGDEPILEGQAIVRSVVADRFTEAEAMLAAAKNTADEQWYREMEAAFVLATGAGLVGLSLRYPEQTLAFLNWFERTFGFAPGAEASAPTTEASETASATASGETRPRTQKYPVTPPDPPFPHAPSGVAVQGQA